MSRTLKLLFLLLSTSTCSFLDTGKESLEELLPPSKPLGPEAALESFQVEEGFHLELVAAEPRVADPIAMAFDEDGRMYVAEMRGYPDDPPTGGEPAGRLRLLEDKDNDGRFETSTIFAERLHWPSGIACWKGGVFVSAPPDILYLKDVDGNGVADTRRVIYTGFGTGKSEDIMNNLKWGLDHQVYGAGSYNGGDVHFVDHPEREPVSVSRRDFTFDPVSGEFEAIEGTSGDFGNCFDDWGNRFVANAGTPVIHAVLPARYLAGNPHLTISQLANNQVFVSDKRVYPISRPEPWRVVRARFWRRWVDTDYQMRASRFSGRELAHQGYITGVAGIAIYRGTVYPDSFRGNAFNGEPAGNLVIRTILERAGSSFTARRAGTEREFIASSDNWFRPVNLVNGPDGCLYLLDMYREVIEDPSAIPKDILEHIDYYTGQDLGRIYRITPDGFRQPSPPRLSTASAADLVAGLEHPQSWWRETAQRLLFERQDPAVVDLLRQSVRVSNLEQGRLHALWALEGLGALDLPTLLHALGDPHPEVRRNATRLAESRLDRSSSIRNAVLKSAGDNDPRVRFQTALTLSSVKQPRAVQALAQIVSRDSSDPWTRAGVLIAVPDRSVALFSRLVGDSEFLQKPEASFFLKELAAMAGARNRRVEILGVLKGLPHLSRTSQSLLALSTWTGLAEGLERAESSLGDFLGQAGGVGEPVRHLWDASLEEAQRMAEDRAEASEQRLQAIQLLSHVPNEALVAILSRLLTAQESSEIQLAAVGALSVQPGSDVGHVLVDQWRGLSPRVRREAAQALFSQADRLAILLDALERESIPVGHLDPVHHDLLLQHSDERIRQRTRRVITDRQPEERSEVLEHYRAALELRGNADRGTVLFKTQCATCHETPVGGRNAGPDLASVQKRSGPELLMDILDPNAKVSSNYLNYRLDTIDGQILTGVLAGETPTTVTLRRAEGIEEIVPRSKIRSLDSMGLSLMPEALEEQLSLQEMADLISFIQSAQNP